MADDKSQNTDHPNPDGREAARSASVEGEDWLVPDAARDPVALPDRRLKWSTAKQFLPVVVLLAGLLTAIWMGWVDQISLTTLADHRETLIAWVDRNGLAAAAVYAGLVTAVAAFSIPAMSVMNISAGFLFGPVSGTAIATVGQTIGGFVVFLAARYAFRDVLARRAGTMVRRMEAGFRRNAFSYMLTVRFMPMFPAWLVNLVPGLLGVSARVFLLGTVIGVIPCTFVFATVGDGLGQVIDKGQVPSLMIFLEPRILLPFVGLALLAITPAIIRWRRGRMQNAAAAEQSEGSGATQEKSCSNAG
ncbi:TVP38/TMEM64 family protein [Fodinicurvata sp. EGI_FJ10296]|uniref:TVP38/TMEM64 family protein n=1 Tax=Fodinicurvata sp. EGI_FJ10296 TaxID=3231908 RepID=UPI0034542940